MLLLQTISEAVALKIKIEAWFKVLKADFFDGGDFYAAPSALILKNKCL